MSSISKQALLVENNTSFPDNNTGYITPASLRAFNVDMIDSTVNQATYSADLAGLQSDIAALEAFTASQQPSFAAINAFTASASSSIGLFNQFTQSANAELDSLSAWTGSWNAWTSSINEIRDGGVLQGYSTRLFFGDLLSASVVANVDGPIASINVLHDGEKLNTSSFNDYSASTNQSILEVSASLYAFSQSIDLIDNTYATTGSNTFTGQQTIQNNLVIEEAGNPLVYTQFTQDSLTNKLQITQAGANGVQINSDLSVGGGITATGLISASGDLYGANIRVGDTGNFRFLSGSSYYNVQLVPDSGGDMAFSRNGASNTKVLVLAGTDSGTTSFQNNPISIAGTVSSLTINAQSTAISGSGSYSVQASTITETATSVTTNASASVRGTFGLTGQSNGDGRAIMLGHSGSLVIGNSTTNSDYSNLSHLSSSTANGNTNLIFKNSTTAADTIISGSANIFANPAAPTAGFRRYVGQNSNIYTHGSSIPQLSGSMAWSPNFNGNIFSNTTANALTWRGPVSSSTSNFNHNLWVGSAVNIGNAAATHAERLSSGVSMIGNLFANNTVNVQAYKTAITGGLSLSGNVGFGATMNFNLNSGSGLVYSSNIQNGGITINNSYNPSSGSVQSTINARATINTVYGIGHVLNIDGVNTAAATQGKAFTANLLAGTFISSSIGTGDSSNILATAIIGNSLTVTGSTSVASFAGADQPNAGQGSLFAGRFNAVDGNKAKTAETIFAVGTGTSSARKTGFLIDSGSNTFVEGSLTITGSVYGNVSASAITAQTASIDLSVANYFTLTLSGSTRINVTNPRPGVTATLVINTDTGASASFSSNVKQPSGSLYVASPSGNVDIISFTAVNTSTVYAFPAQSFV